MKVLTLSTVFPNPSQPTLGTFVQERTRRIATACEVRVVAPVPWFPLNRLIRGGQWSGIPPTERRDGLTIHHPRIVCIPRYLKLTDGLLYAASLIPWLRRLRRDFPFDVIDAHFAYPDGLAAAVLGAVLDCPVTITLRGSIARLATYRLHRPQLRWALTRAARVLAVSQSLKRTAVALGIPEGKITVVPNGVDTDRFFPRDRAEARRALSLPLERPIILSVGGLNEGKGHHLIVNEMPLLLRHRADLLYVVVGGGRPGDSSRALIEQGVKRHGLEGAVRMAGPRPHGEIPLWLAAADVFCLATRSEGWANVLLEALACGTPVVSTAVGGNGEIVTSSSLGTLVPHGDGTALRRAILDALARPWDTAAMVAHARRHSWDTAARDVIQEIEKARAQHRARNLMDARARGVPGGS